MKFRWIRINPSYGIAMVDKAGGINIDTFIAMLELNELELALLEGLATKHPSLEAHLPHLKVQKRDLTNTGLLAELAYENFNGPFDDINALFSNAELIIVPNLKKGLAYIIDVTDGRITSIEFVTYGEKWNGQIAAFTIVQNNPEEQN